MIYKSYGFPIAIAPFLSRSHNPYSISLIHISHKQKQHYVIKDLILNNTKTNTIVEDKKRKT